MFGGAILVLFSATTPSHCSTIEDLPSPGLSMIPWVTAVDDYWLTIFKGDYNWAGLNALIDDVL